MRKKLLLLILLVSVSLMAACRKDYSEDHARFKQEYELLNGQTNSSGKEYRSIEIDENNPFVYIDFEDAVKMMQSGKTFILYCGANWCPWCRSILPVFIQTAREKKIDVVYYVDVKPDNLTENEKRDIYSVNESGEIYLSHEGTEGYHEFIRYAASVLNDYSRSDVPSLDGTPFAGQKRVGAPNFLLIKDGKAIQMITGISSLQKDAYMELTDEINDDVKNIFNRFFNDYRDAR